MQTYNLIIPMGGFGKRFEKKSYSKYKTLLPIDKNITIIEKLISNFNIPNLKVVIIVNKDIYKKYKNSLKKKNIKIIVIENHNSGPLFSLYKSFKKLEKLIKKNESLFISYSDINWIWDLKKVISYIKNKNSVIFTHKGFHPHLELNNKSDFCKVKNNKVSFISQKKIISKNYKDDCLAIGCYYFKNFEYIKNYFFENNYFNKKKEYYIVSLVNYLISKNISINTYKIKKFVHLGIPEQYIDYLNWKKYFENEKKYLIKNNIFFQESTTIMLMAGLGKRVKDLKYKKFLIPINKTPIFKYVFNIFGTNNKIIITNKNLKKYVPNKKKYDFLFVKKNDSMFKTVLDSSQFIRKFKNFFLTSCDCFGNFEFFDLRKKIDDTKADLIFFGFNFSYFQKNLNCAHTQIINRGNLVTRIKVKEKFNKNYLGHAGFFWIKNGSIFNHIPKFLLTKNYKQKQREIILDDYFKFLISQKLIRASFLNLKNYIHIGSTNEYLEYLYWKNYFN